MKKASFVITFVSYLAMCFLVSGCDERKAPASVAEVTQTPVVTKTIEVIIEPVKPSFSHTTSTSFKVKSTAQPNVSIQWDGYKFIGKTDSGSTFLDFSPDSAFQKQQTIDFKIKKKVTITQPTGSLNTTSSETISLRRGVPQKL